MAAGDPTSQTGSLSPWAAPYVTGMLGKGQALANQGYQGYSGPLTAGASAGQQAAFQGVAGLAVPTQQMGAFQPQQFTAQAAQDYMNPYVQAALDPQIEEARRQAQISRLGDASRLTQAGAYGGSRQAIMESELNRNLGQNLAGITGQGYQDAYTQAMNQFNTEQGRQQTAQDSANQYGLQALAAQSDLGAQERAIEQQGMSADLAQFEEERDFPYKQVQYQQSLLQGLPISARQTSYQQPSALSEFIGSAGGILDLFRGWGNKDDDNGAG
tara:strand:- start:406 stop:1218 length:813 start_codon:yes stop_codon:yes gene_type:complete